MDVKRKTADKKSSSHKLEKIKEPNSRCYEDVWGVTKLSVRVFQKMRHISFENQYFLKIQQATKPRDCRGFIGDCVKI